MRTSLLDRVDAGSSNVQPPIMMTEKPGQLIEPALYRELIVSHRRMERLADPSRSMRGLRDLDTGEVFLIDERRLFESRR